MNEKRSELIDLSCYVNFFVIGSRNPMLWVRKPKKLNFLDFVKIFNFIHVEKTNREYMLGETFFQ